MAYLVIAYPDLEQTDFDWIQEYRGKYDNQFNLVKPHFSVVFGVQDIDRYSFLTEVKRQTEQVKPFAIDIRVATMTQYHDGSRYQEFLVPDAGYSDFVKLHDQLYSGLFAPHLRFDIAYIPHITIADSESASTAKQRIDELNAQGISIHGRIGNLDVVEHAGGTISTLEKITLQQ
jgi:hypothetical protein